MFTAFSKGITKGKRKDGERKLQSWRKSSKKHDLFVLSDEIYCELTYGGKNHISIAAIDGMDERTVVINGFSKSYAIRYQRGAFRICYYSERTVRAFQTARLIRGCVPK